MRQTGDYEDLMNWTLEDIEPLLPQVEDFIGRIKAIIKNPN